jgi:hypothetical protein
LDRKEVIDIFEKFPKTYREKQNSLHLDTLLQIEEVMNEKTAPIRFFYCYSYTKKTDELDMEKNISNEKKIESIIEKYGEETAYRYIEGNNQVNLLADKSIDSPEIKVPIINKYQNKYLIKSTNVAPTFDQVYPHLITHTVLIASGGDKLLIDPLFDWIVDSGCTSHMCNNKSLFTELHLIQSAITTAGALAKVTGVGTAKIRVELDDQIINFSLLNTLLVLSLPVNLISQSKLEPNYYFTTLHGYQARSRDTHELVLEARLIEGLYVVNQERRFETALSVKESLVIWHERLGYISVKHLQTMRNEKATGVKFSDKEVSDFKCDACTLSKMHRQPIRNKPRPRSIVPGETTHWDTYGPMPTSLNGSTWLVLEIDDATKIIFTKTYKSKTDVHQKIKGGKLHQ